MRYRNQLVVFVVVLALFGNFSYGGELTEADWREHASRFVGQWHGQYVGTGNSPIGVADAKNVTYSVHFDCNWALAKSAIRWSWVVSNPDGETALEVTGFNRWNPTKKEIEQIFINSLGERADGTVKLEEGSSTTVRSVSGPGETRNDVAKITHEDAGWTHVVSVTQPDGTTHRPPAVKLTRYTWEEEEWNKLKGVWRAPLANGGHRIKRISRGEEILEVYDRDKELSWKTKVDMTITRHHGINFFTVTNRVQLHPPSDESLEGQYTSIYRVHDGKWYEQLRGIFANNQNLAPDEFLVYEKVRE